MKPSNIPADLKYAETHEWARLQGDRATVGVTDHAQQELLDVVFVELPQVGRKVKKGEACVVVESVKAASDVYSPVSGEVVAVNPDLAKNPALVNTDPYGKGWMFQIKASAPKELDGLLSAEKYRQAIGG
ncbi:MAG: glycine cleavage system protein GcvH [Candidatus Omnitrophica bacterium]|nr:glycine cleavage system protein GcvH [Candidatus Omnitrophota bacterium]